MARPKSYTKKTLAEAVERYFASITRTVAVKERVDTGERDKMGHVIYTMAPVINNLGEEMLVTEYIVPPSVAGLSEYLGIHRSTWAEYCDPVEYPEFSDTTTRARGRMRAWREEQLVTRKDVKGIIFDLQNNYGYSEKRQVELGERASKTLAVSASGMDLEEKRKLLEEIGREFGGGANEEINAE